MKKVINFKAGTVTFSFDGGLDPVVCDASDMHETVGDYCVLFGINHRVGDNAAIARKDKAGNVINVTEAMRRDAVVEAWEHLRTTKIAEDGTGWNMVTTARAPAQNATIAALATRLGKTYAETEAFLANAVTDELKAL